MSTEEYGIIPLSRALKYLSQAQPRPEGLPENPHNHWVSVRLDVVLTILQSFNKDPGLSEQERVVLHDGKVYVAVDDGRKECTGCAFDVPNHPADGCLLHVPGRVTRVNCDSQRYEGAQVIWIEKE